jgi:hypothetical protein
MSPSIENDSNSAYRNIILASVIIIAIGLRFLPLLFSGLYFAKKYQAIIFPLITIWASDLCINYSYTGTITPFYDGFYWQYGCYILIALLGVAISQQINYTKVMGVTLLSSLLFFVISNFGVWFCYNMYTHDFAGLISCYIAGVPFLKNAVMGDLIFSTALFVSVQLLYKRFKVAVVPYRE